MANNIDSLTTSTVDTSMVLPINIDEAIVKQTVFFDLDSALSVNETETKVIDTVAESEYNDDWKIGLEGSSRQYSFADNSGILTIIVVLFVAVSMNFKECRKLFKHFIEELSSNKKRENAFDEHSNHESKLTLLTIIQFIVYGSIILYGIASYRTYGSMTNQSYAFGKLMVFTGLFLFYYIFQICAYGTIGYVFAGKNGCIKWLRSFNATQSLAGAGLMLPALMTLFYPMSINSMFFVSCIIYVICKSAFIIKGFSIFYNNILSIVYFILYLCALEIIPVIYIYKFALLII